MPSKKIPKIKLDKTGRRYVLIGKKKVYLSKNVTERELIKFIVGRLKPKRRATKTVDRPSKVVVASVPTSFVQSGPTIADNQIKNDLYVAQRKLQLLESAAKKEPADQLIVRKKYNLSDDQLDQAVKDFVDMEQQKSLAEQKLKQAESTNTSLKETVRKTRKAKLDTRLIKAQAEYKTKYHEALKKELGGKSEFAYLKAKAEALNKNISEMKKKIPLNLKSTELEQVLLAHKIELQPLRHKAEKAVENYSEKVLKIQEMQDDIDKYESSDDEEEIAGSGKNETGGLWTNQINSMMEIYRPNYLGCVASNESKYLIPEIKDQRQICWIQNTASKVGVHWVCYFIDRDKKTIEYYDSLADPMPANLFKDIQPILKKIEGKDTAYTFKYNLIRDQHVKTDTCGYFCVVFLRDRMNGISFKVASGFDKMGEKRVGEVLKNMHPDPVSNGVSGGSYASHHVIPPFVGSWPIEGGRKIWKPEPFLEVHAISGKGWRDVLSRALEGAKKIGKHIIDKITSTKPRNGWSPSIRSILGKYGNSKITNIKVYRSPIKSFIHTALNWLSLGTFERNLRDAGYDQAMHLFLTITLQDGTVIRFDKNHVIEAKVVHADNTHNAEVKTVGHKNIPLNEFLNKGIDHAGQRYFHYNSRSSNCQIWIIDNLQANGLLTPDIKTWVLQDVDKIYKNLGLLETINQKITDTGAQLDTMVYGEGKRKKKKKTKKTYYGCRTCDKEGSECIGCRG